jgi:uncharacterized membrane protein YfcA
MIEFPPTACVFFLIGLVAGFIDAVAGGGGLLTLPSLLVAGLPPEVAMGTNKGQSIFGSTASLTKYAHAGLVDPRRAWVSILPALLASAAGVLVLVFAIPNDLLRPLVIVLLVAVAVFMVLHRPSEQTRPSRSRPVWVAIAIACPIAFYDGFFGPGTGMFLILAYAWLYHDPLDRASANAKVVNCGSNWGSFLTFLALGRVNWLYALPMGLGQLCGGYLGAHVTIRRGKTLVRYVGIAVCLALVGRLAWQMLS